MKIIGLLTLLLAIQMQTIAQNSAQDAVVLFYTMEATGQRGTPVLYFGNQKLGDVTKAQAIRLVLSPGTYHFALREDAHSAEQLSLSPRAGQELFFRVTAEGFFVGSAGEAIANMPTNIPSVLPKAQVTQTDVVAAAPTRAPVPEAARLVEPTARPQIQPVAAVLNAMGDSRGKTVLQDGTPVRMRINRTISSADAKVGDNVDFEVLDDIKAGDLVIVPKGGVALATVTEAQSKRRMGRGGKLNVNIDQMRMVNGDKVPLRAVKENKGGGHVGAMTGAIVATSIVFFPAAPFFLFMHGKDITIPKGTEITAYVNGDLSIDVAKLNPNAVPTPAPAQPIPAPFSAVESAMVAINSVPDGAEIILDGKYVGNTPSSLSLPPGDHSISLEKTGYKLWKRTVSTTAGSNLTIAPTLDKN